MHMPVLDIKNLSAGYGGRPVLSDVSLAINESERVALIGPNGCGKSTLLRTVTAEVPESSGRILYLGEDITDLETNVITSKGIGYLRQVRNIFPGLTVGENLELASMDGAQSENRRNIVMRSFPMLEGRGKIRAGLLSGGERQALATAMVLLRPVRLLFLDEPVAGLSQKNAGQLLDCISSLQKDDGFALMLVEHRLKMIRPHVSRVIIMVRGGVAEDTSDTGILEDQERLERHYLL